MPQRDRKDCMVSRMTRVCTCKVSPNEQPIVRLWERLATSFEQEFGEGVTAIEFIGNKILCVNFREKVDEFITTHLSYISTDTTSSYYSIFQKVNRRAPLS